MGSDDAPCDRKKLMALLVDIIDGEDDSLKTLTMKTSLEKAEKELGLSKGRLYIENRAWADQVLYDILHEMLEKNPQLVEHLEEPAAKADGKAAAKPAAKAAKKPAAKQALNQNKVNPYKVFMEMNRERVYAETPMAKSDVGVFLKTMKAEWGKASEKVKAMCKEMALRGEVPGEEAAKKDDAPKETRKRKGKEGKDAADAAAEPAAKKAKAAPKAKEPKEQTGMDMYLTNDEVKQRIKDGLMAKDGQKPHPMTIRKLAREEWAKLSVEEQTKWGDKAKPASG
eukprot:TRINITY_DN8609_c0_g1_i1.p1 TRINITY_DN8609_c0_g1~~TRINITY_DN8609_c0_g1_i1.p1  ORF type:complete len:283 (+),score=151.82 TRINITY_DN8609_c0_g1_i1:99-947(+)